MSLPDADADSADAGIERMRSALRASPFAEPAGMVTASFGRAVSRPGLDSVAAPLREADIAMYRDKRRPAADVISS